MSKFSINIAEKPILNFLKHGGNIHSSECNILIAAFIDKALKDQEIKEIFMEYGFPREFYIALYKSMLISQKNPVINVSGPLLVPTLVFMEPFRLRSLLALLAQESSSVTSKKEFVDALTKVSFEVADMIYNSHTKAYGRCDYLDNKTAKPASEEKEQYGCCGWILGTFFTIMIVMVLKSC